MPTILNLGDDEEEAWSLSPFKGGSEFLVPEWSVVATHVYCFGRASTCQTLLIPKLSQRVQIFKNPYIRYLDPKVPMYIIWEYLDPLGVYPES